jgi:hypothetical protein
MTGTPGAAPAEQAVTVGCGVSPTKFIESNGTHVVTRVVTHVVCLQPQHSP